MKKFGLVFVTVSLLLLASCSQVFEAGVSGKVVTLVSGSEQGAEDVYVYAYSDKASYERDLAKFESGEITSPSAGYVPCTTTLANGEFTINKIVWETKHSKFGKTADVTSLYLIFYHEDYKPCGTGPISIISGSTNASAVRKTIEQVRFPMPLFSSQIDDAAGSNIQDESDSSPFDNVELLLTDKNFNVFEGRGARKSTVKAEHGVDSLKYSHGHFAGLGEGIKWTGDSIDVNIVWDANKNGEADEGELYYPVKVTRDTTGIPSKIKFTKTVTL